MKKILFFLFAVVILNNMAAQQKPTIMVVPDEDWCVKHGFVLPGTNVADIKQALADDAVSGIITVMTNLMSEQGYELTDLRETLRDINRNKMLDETHLSKGDGVVQESELDQAMRVARTDIALYLKCEILSHGPRSLFDYEIRIIDTASKKGAGGVKNNSPATSAPLSVLLNESANTFMPELCEKLMAHMNRMATSGREGSVTFKIADDCPIRSFESVVEFNGESGELADLIDYWMNENTVSSQYTQSAKTRNTLIFNQVHFPLKGVSRSGFGGKGKPKSLTMAEFIKPLDNILSGYGITMSITPDGQGKAHVVLGGESNL